MSDTIENKILREKFVIDASIKDYHEFLSDGNHEGAILALMRARHYTKFLLRLQTALIKKKYCE